MIKTISNYFFNDAKGIIIDNAYDAYTLNCLIKYYESNNILFLQSQDNDLNYLDRFSNVEYLSLPQEAYNFDNLNRLTKLKGLSIYSSKIDMIDENILKKLQYLNIIYDDKTKVDFTTLDSLKSLRIVNCPFVDLCIYNSLEYLELNYCKKIINLNFLGNLTMLKNLKLSYLPALNNIQGLERFEYNLEKISIIDCKKVDNVELTLSKLKELKEIQIITEEIETKLKLKSLCFIKELVKLESFTTNYKIEDGDLSYLLKLKDVIIIPFYKHYNLKDKDLPHNEVLINDNGVIKKVKLCSLEKGKDDSRIILEN